jgi:hypothetical protein
MCRSRAKSGEKLGGSIVAPLAPRRWADRASEPWHGRTRGECDSSPIAIVLPGFAATRSAHSRFHMRGATAEMVARAAERH